MVDIDYRSEAIRLLKKWGKTSLWLTHNIQDAVDLGGYIYIVTRPPLRIVNVLGPGDYGDVSDLARLAKAAFRQ